MKKHIKLYILTKMTLGIEGLNIFADQFFNACQLVIMNNDDNYKKKVLILRKHLEKAAHLAHQIQEDLKQKEKEE